MQIRHVLIKNFRGIQNLDWLVTSSVVCLIGPGDSTKSTILDAIDLALSSKWNLTFEDSDFYQGNTNNNIEITITVGDLSDYFLTHFTFGHLKRGWNKKDGIHDEPQENDEEVLSIRLSVSSSLEPEWVITNDRDVEEKKISTKDREKLKANRLSSYVDKHLYWGQGSALSNLTTDKKENASPVIIEAHRKAITSAKIDEIDEFKDTVTQTENIAKRLGAKPRGKLKPALDSRAISFGVGAIGLHDDNIPIRLSGLGTRRLIALGIQMLRIEEGSLLLIDELEHGLEPHRIRHLLQHLQLTAKPL